MKLVIALVLLVLGSLLFHWWSPWWMTPIASNWVAIDDTIELARNLMAQASREVLDGFELNTDVEIVRYPDRYMDKRGAKMWDTVQEIIRELKP